MTNEQDGATDSVPEDGVDADLVKWLRECGREARPVTGNPLCDEAADRIEVLLRDKAAAIHQRDDLAAHAAKLERDKADLERKLGVAVGALNRCENADFLNIHHCADRSAVPIARRALKEIGVVDGWLDPARTATGRIEAPLRDTGWIGEMAKALGKITESYPPDTVAGKLAADVLAKHSSGGKEGRG